MTTKRERPSPDQWAKLDAALGGLRERTPPGAASPLSREIARRAEALRAALESGWRIRDLAAFFRETAGIDVSPSTIQAALRQALTDAQSDAQADAKRPRAKRPRKRSATGDPPAPGPAQAMRDERTGFAPAPGQPGAGSGTEAEAPRPQATPPLGTTLTQGATKRGQR